MDLGKKIQQRSHSNDLIPLIDDRNLYEEIPMKVVQGRGKVAQLRTVSESHDVVKSSQRRILLAYRRRFRVEMLHSPRKDVIAGPWPTAIMSHVKRPLIFSLA